MAQRIHDEIKAELWKVSPAGGTVHSALDEWAKDADEADRYRVGKLKRIYKNRAINAATSKSFEEILPQNPGTFNRYVNLIHAALNRQGVKLKIQRRPSVRSRIRWLAAEEWAALQRNLPAHLLPLARFAVYTGLRQRNVTYLEWSQVDLTRRVAWIHADQAKARRAIGIPLSDAAMVVLRSQRGIHEQYVFPYKGKPLGRIGAGKVTEKKSTAWGRALKRARIENFTWHGLRHTWASWHVMGGTPLPVLMELGGWKSLSMVQRYAHLAPDHLAAHANNAKPYATKQRHSKKKVA